MEVRKMGKLDAIFAKLKNKRSTDSPILTNQNTENNNNSKELANLNQDASEPADLSTETSRNSSPLTGGSSRRKSRKSRPRNISEFKATERVDKEDDYNNDFENTDHRWNIDVRNGSECDGYELTTASRSCVTTPDSPQPLDLSSDLGSNFQDESPEDSQDADKLVIDESFNDDSCSIPLDLSICKRNQNGHQATADKTYQDLNTADQSKHLNTADNHSNLSMSSAFPPESTDAKVLKDYANNTMNELLKIYGLGIPNTAEIQDKMQLTKYHVAQLAATANLGLIPNELKPTSPESTINGQTKLNGFNPKKGIYSSAKKPLMSPQNGFYKFSAKQLSSPSISKALDSKLTGLKALSPNNKTILPDYTKYLKRFNNGNQCGGAHCKELGYREHYHCLDCSKVYIKKEEMVRHFKWHKKREESLQHGFMRYSPMDNCQPKFGVCTHHGRQTHYHCIQRGCDKVYISTSDVQMHANYHRKDSAIILEGFQRFRATEDCGTTACQFYGQRTTHFHCRRATCNFTFKNKADMEKHKTYHQKDEILSKDGFKKFMKYESCLFPTCKYTKISNHIHCIRPGCDYVLHSTAQLYSHKRKHERRDFENAYQSLRNNPENRTPIAIPKLSQSTQILTSIPTGTVVQALTSMSLPVKISQTQTLSPVMTSQPSPSKLECDSPTRETTPPQIEDENKPSSWGNYADELTGEKLNDSLTLPIPKIAGEKVSSTKTSVKSATPSPVKTAFPLPQEVNRSPVERKDKDEPWKNYLKRYTANDPCNSKCSLLYKDHYHCLVVGCSDLFRAKDAVREHAKFHEQQDRISPMVYEVFDEEKDCTREDCELNRNKKHYHCNWTGCKHVIEAGGSMFGRLEHYRIHEYAKVSSGRAYKSATQGVLDEDMARRRRGRPPKYSRSKIPSVPKVHLSDDEITDSVQRYLLGDVDETSKVINGFRKFDATESCPDNLCLYLGKDHFHCARSRCYHATDRMDVLNLHSKDFHNFVYIKEGFEFYDRNVNCRRNHCHNNKANRHFHCTRPGCDYSFVRHGTMRQHESKHDTSISKSRKSSKFVPIVPNTAAAIMLSNKNIVKAAGTFYPLSGLNNVSMLSVSCPSVVSMGQQNLITSAPLISASTSATLIPINSFQVPGIGLIPQLIVPATPTFQTYVPVSMSSVEPMSALPVPQQETNEADSSEPTWSELRNTMHFTNNQNCCRPFCKLKKKDHYHCVECNQAFSDPARLRNHIGKHGIKYKRGPPIDNGLDLSSPAKRIKQEIVLSQGNSDAELTSSSLNLDPNVFSKMWKSEESSCGNKLKIKCEPEDSFVGTESDHSSLSPDENGQETQDVSKWSGRKRTATRHEDFIDTDVVLPKVQKLSSPKVKHDSDQLQEGYSRFRFNEDCLYMKCAYKHSSTHYHCLRSDCGYGFSDRSRLIQHTLRHERIDKIMGEEFRQFRASVHCSYGDCEFSAKASHFHCLKCYFSCADSSKVSAHRKHHLKLDNISSKGFIKYVGSQDCETPFCAHSTKQTHYHCTFQNCKHAVLGPAQMAPHKLKHSEKAEKHS